MKKIVSLTAMLLTFVILATSVNAAPVKKISDWAAETVKMANASGLIPQNRYVTDYTVPVHRGAVADLLVNAYSSISGQKYYPQTKSPFSDTSSSSVRTVYELGIMNGRADGTFGYYDYITREEMAKVLLTFRAVALGRQLGLPEYPYSSFTDFQSVSDWAKPYVAQANADWLISGYTDGTFRPKELVSLEMAIVLIMRCAQFPTKEVPVIKSLAWDSVVSSAEDLDVSVWGEGNVNLYGININSSGYAEFLGSGIGGQSVTVKGGTLKSNSLYYIYAESNGVFSELVKVYTDNYNLFLKCDTFASAGEYEIIWERIPGVTEYIITVTEQRNSRHEGDIPPNTPVSYKVQWENYRKINVNPNRRYKIEINAGNYYAFTEVYVSSVSATGASEILENYPTTKAEADALQVTVTVPVWKINQKGQKYASNASFQVHYMIADKVKLVFEEIFNGAEKFPIKDVGGYSWRGGTTEHNSGTAIDINANENYCIYNNGTTIGSYWKPYVDPYSITPYGDVIKAFEKYGFTWGGDAWSNPRDYMHFSYLGT